MSELSPKQRLVWLGLRPPTAQRSDGSRIINALKDAFGDDYEADFLDAYDTADPQSFDDFEDFLTNNGVGSDMASKIRSEFEGRYPDFQSFDDAITDLESYRELLATFPTSSELRSDNEDEDGEPIAGIKFYESGGIGRNGQDIPPGGVEVYGREVHFSKSSEIKDDSPQGDSDGDTRYQFEYTNLSVSDQQPAFGETITVSADVENPAQLDRTETIQLFENNSVVEAKSLTLPGKGGQATISFDWSSREYQEYDIKIGPTSPIQVTVVHPSPGP